MTSPTPAKGANGAHLAPRNIPWLQILPVVTLLLAIAIPLLLLYYANAVLDSADGTEVEVTDPAAPGFEALVESTPSFLALGVDDNDVLTSIAVITLANQDMGGTVLLIPPETLSANGTRVVDAFANQGPDAARLSVAKILDADVTEFQVLDNSGWGRLTAPVAPVSMDLADDLYRPNADGTNTTVFSAGTVAVPSNQVGDFLGWVNPGETPFNRMVRQRLFWSAWITTVRASENPDAVPGESNVGLGRFVRGLSDGVVAYRELPVSGNNAADPATASFSAIEPQVTAMVGEMMPFPVSAEPGDRPRVRLLDGVGGLDVLATFSGDLSQLGAQIVRVGNATEFGAADSLVVYHDDRFATEANAFGDLLQAQVRFEPLTDAVLDITVIIGKDNSST